MSARSSHRWRLPAHHRHPPRLIRNSHLNYIVCTVRLSFLPLLLISPVIGHAQNDCPYDLNFDGFTGYNELLFFAADFGSPDNTE